MFDHDIMFRNKYNPLDDDIPTITRNHPCRGCKFNRKCGREFLACEAYNTYISTSLAYKKDAERKPSMKIFDECEEFGEYIIVPSSYLLEFLEHREIKSQLLHIVSHYSEDVDPAYDLMSDIWYFAIPATGIPYIMGAIGFSAQDFTKIGFLEYLYVRSKYLKKGIGKELMSLAKAECKTLYVNAAPRARQFYTMQGFVGIDGADDFMCYDEEDKIDG